MKIISILVSTLMISSAAFASDIVNTQVTDAITTTNVKVVGEPPAQSMSNEYLKTANTLKAASAACKQQPDHCACLKDVIKKYNLYSNNAAMINQSLKELNCQPYTTTP